MTLAVEEKAQTDDTATTTSNTVAASDQTNQLPFHQHDDHPASSPVQARYLIKRPKALQWFHNGTLQRATDEERQAGRFELFLDLLCEFLFLFVSVRIYEVSFIYWLCLDRGV